LRNSPNWARKVGQLQNPTQKEISHENHTQGSKF
jgi:hypothetical protein